MLNCKKIDTSIRRAKEKLKNKAAKTGVYENFGVEEARDIGNKFIDSSDYTDEMNNNREKLQEFREWCMWYDGN